MPINAASLACRHGHDEENRAVTFRDILVLTDQTLAATPRAVFAANLAARSGATLTGAFLRSDLRPHLLAMNAANPMPGIAMGRLMGELNASCAEAASGAKAAFHSAAAGVGIEAGWLVLDGDTVHPMAEAARRVDLTIAPSSIPVPMAARSLSAAELGLASGGPLIVTPDGGGNADVGQRVVMAWKEGRESARALRDALPFVQRAEILEILAVSQNEPSGWDALREHLRRRGVRADFVHERRPDSEAPAAIRERAESLQADLVVMGLYGRGRLSEFVLGGASRDLLHDPPCPLFVSH